MLKNGSVLSFGKQVLFALRLPIMLLVIPAIILGTSNSFIAGLKMILRDGIIVLVIGVGVIILLWFVITSIFKKSWTQSIVRAIALAISLLLAYLGLRSGDYVHLVILYPMYQAAIFAQPKEILRFHWGENDGSFVPEYIEKSMLVYDVRPASRIAVKEGEIWFKDGSGGMQTEHFIGNFFIERHWMH